MTKTTEFASTPYYVLRSENQPLCPIINLGDSDTGCVCIYGFSDKPVYDKFIKNAGQGLTPYPLVKGYLANQIETANSDETRDACQQLVILDATDPTQPVLAAATMATVLSALQSKTPQVPVEYEVVFDPETSAYRLKDKLALHGI